MGSSPVRSELPTLQEEVDRKAFETLEWLTHSVAQGRISAHQFSTGVDVLFMTVSGLLRKDFIELISEAQALCPDAPLELKRVFSRAPGFRNASLLRVTWTVGEDRVLMGEAHGTPRYMNFDTAREARDFFNGVGEKLAPKGYKEV
jgi:hypothetical protein